VKNVLKLVSAEVGSRGILHSVAIVKGKINFPATGIMRKNTIGKSRRGLNMF